MVYKYYPESDTHTYCVHEVYYDKNGRIDGVTENPVSPLGESPEELKVELQRFLGALEKPVLTEDENGKLKDLL